MKFVVVTGGVVSGLGKGVTISSLGRVLQACGLRVTSVKIDPYLNVDAGTMSPFEHGETFVLDDGGETDLDLGNYERFLDVTLTAAHNITSGKVYREVIRRERAGAYLGKTVQMVPHVTDMVMSMLREVSAIPVDGSGLPPQVCLVEVGGTVGDIESAVFLEALRQFQFTLPSQDLALVHLSMVPVMGGGGNGEEAEQKTKPTQHSVKELRALGLQPNILACRAPVPITEATKRKLATFCQVPTSRILSVSDVKNLYHVPLALLDQGAHHILCERLELSMMMPWLDAPRMDSWKSMVGVVDVLDDVMKKAVGKITHVENACGIEVGEPVRIVVVGKYLSGTDAYLSLTKSLQHASVLLQRPVIIDWVDASDLETPIAAHDGVTIDALMVKYETAWNSVRAAAGVLVPGGFGVRGLEGKIAAASYARTAGVPYLGICLGMQVMVMEAARSLLKLEGATSQEFAPSSETDAATVSGGAGGATSVSNAPSVIMFMPEINPHEMGGTMRLGARKTLVNRLLKTPKETLAEVTAAAESGGGDYHAAEVTKRVAADRLAKQVDNDAVADISLAAEIYGLVRREDLNNNTITSGYGGVMERHRHRYEVNPNYVPALEAVGLHFSGKDGSGCRMEVAELSRRQHPFYFGTQFHPEFKSRPTRPSPPFYAFIAAAAGEYDRLGAAGVYWQAHVSEVLASALA